MKENGVAEKLATIGVLIIIGCVFAGFLIFILSEGESLILAIAFAIGGFIEGMLFIGFSEGLSLLQKSINKQDEILNAVRNEPNKDSPCQKCGFIFDPAGKFCPQCGTKRADLSD